MERRKRTCMRGLVGDSTMTSAVRPFCTATSTALRATHASRLLRHRD